MRRLLLLATVAAALGATTPAHAATYCAPSVYTDNQGNIVIDPNGTEWACVYSSGGYWCHKITGPNGNWTEYCVGATGARECVYTFPAEPDCRDIPGGITELVQS